VALITIITTRKFICGSFLFAFIVLLLTIFLGRFFCGWICPMGTLLDASDHLNRKLRKEKNPARRTLRSWKYSLLIISVVAAIFSIQLIWFIDPISLITRSFTIAVYPLFSFVVESVLNFFILTGIFEESVFAIYDAVRGNIIPIAPVNFKSSIFILAMFIGILFLTIVTKRFWCRYLCPLGALLGIFSKFRLSKRVVNDKCIDCGACYRNCKMDAINEDFRTYSQFECIECMNCVATCPTDAFEYKFNLKKSPAAFDVSRRRFIYSGLGGLLAIGATKTAFINKSDAGEIIRPPGAVSESEFLDRCIRCHACIKICSTTGKYLQPSLLESGWEGIWSPQADARHGYCEYDCNLCGKVCPTGAIHPLTVQQKHKIIIGTAYFDKSRCIPWYRNEDCIVCEEHCPTPEKAIKFEIRSVQNADGTIKSVKFPYVDEKLCIGCGICVTKCPIIGKPGIFVTSARQQRWEDHFLTD